MQFIQDACLVNLMINSIFVGPQYKPYSFTWERIGKHGIKFGPEYKYDDAQCLLQLSLMVTSTNYENKPLDAPSWFQDHPLFYDECPMKLISEVSPKSFLNKSALLGHVLYNQNNNIIFIVFTGTINHCMAALDLDYNQVELDGILNHVPGLRAHGGVYTAYKSIRAQLMEILSKYINANPQIIICGHSLGAALSQICCLDFAYYKPLHYTFAGPMVFNEIGFEVFTKLVTNSYRIANLSDLVVLSPLPIMPNKNAFFHIGNTIQFQRNYGDYSLNHSWAYVQEYNLME